MGRRRPRNGIGRAFLSVLFLATVAGNAFAALPFLTDDAGTLGKGTSQVELSYAAFTDKETVNGSVVKTSGNLPGATFGYGVADPLDLTLGFGRVWGKVTVDGVSPNDPGSIQFTLDAKWRLYKSDATGFQFALKPQAGYSHVVGGTGIDHTVTYGGWLLATREHGTLAVSLNAGYSYNVYGSASDRAASRSSLWSVSALSTYDVLKGWRLGCDVGASTNPVKADGTLPVYAQVGAIYSPNGNVDLSLGLKFGITRPEPDFAGIAGVTVRF